MRTVFLFWKEELGYLLTLLSEGGRNWKRALIEVEASNVCLTYLLFLSLFLLLPELFPLHPLHIRGAEGYLLSELSRLLVSYFFAAIDTVRRRCRAEY